MRKTNHLAVLSLVVFQQVLGFVWYSRFLFGIPWMRGFLKKPVEMNPHNSIPFIASILGAFLFCYGLDWLMRKIHWDHPVRGATLGLAVGILFIAPGLLTHYLFLSIAPVVFVIDAGMSLTAAAITGFVLGLWKGKGPSSV